MMSGPAPTHTDSQGEVSVSDGSLNAQARQLRALHDRLLVLPNAWDACSAALIAGAGASAIATTSGGVAWALGRPDGQRLSRADMVGAVARIVSVVDVPLTADVEAGYGPSTDDVAITVRDVVGAGAVGVNLEDSAAPGGPLFTVDEQVRRIRAARRAATEAGVPDLVINARTDVFLFQIGEPAGRTDEVRTRADAFAAAGADCLFVPGLLDLALLESLAKAIPLPLNAMAVPGGPTVNELGAAGVRRISVGTAMAQTAYAAVRQAAGELLAAGTLDACAGAASFGELNGLFERD